MKIEFVPIGDREQWTWKAQDGENRMIAGRVFDSLDDAVSDARRHVADFERDVPGER